MAKGCKPKNKSGGRRSINDKQLWERRVKVYYRIGTGYTIPEVAKEFDISQDMVRLDLKGMAETREVPQIKIMVAGIYEKIIREGWLKFQNEKSGFNQVGFLREIAETATKLARMNGLIAEPSIHQHLNIFGGVNSDNGNGYDKWPDNRLRQEFGTRRLTLPSGDRKKSKK